MPKITIPPKLEKFLTTHKRFKVAAGGRGGAKSQTFADMLLMKSQVEGAKIGCFREMQNSIEDSVHSLLKHEIDRLELEGFTAQKADITNTSGGEFKFKGLARNPDAVKSMHGFKYFWVEEAHSISKESLEKLTPTIREEGAECWFSLNPQSSEDPMSQRFLIPYWDELMKTGIYEDDLHLIVLINYQDNPWFPDNLEQERLWDYEHKPRAEYDHIWGGQFNDQIENSIILPEWFDAAVDAHKKLGFKPRGLKVLSHDPSDLGGDAKGIAYRHGVVFLDIDELQTGDVNEGCDWATAKAQENQVNVFIWDGDGLGASLKRQINKSLPKIDHLMFKGSETPDFPDRIYQPADNDDPHNRRSNKDTFRNKRAQYYWGLRDRFYNTYRAINGEYIDPDDLISISSEIKNLTKLRSEICRIPLVHNGSGRIQIMSKPEMKTKHKIQSPNMADSIMMAFANLPTSKRKGPSPQPVIKVI